MSELVEKLLAARAMIDEALALTGGICEPGPAPGDTITRNVFGNSITVGYGASSPWVALRSAAKGWPFVSHAVNGAMVWDVAGSAYGVTVADDSRSIVALGTNDLRHWGASNIAKFQRAHRALIAWLAVPEAQKTRGRSLAAAGWGDTYAFGVGKVSSTLGAELSFPFDGDSLLVSSIAQVGNAGAFDVLIDGVVKASVSCNAGVPATLNGATYGPQLDVITGLGAGPHTAKIKVTSSSGNAYFEWAAAPTSSAKVEVYNTPEQVGATATATAACNAAQAADVAFLQGVGLDILIADIHAAVGLSDMPDGTHPNDAGQAKIAAVEPI